MRKQTRINLGIQPVGNNHTTSHLFAKMSIEDLEKIEEVSGFVDAESDIYIIYLDRFNNKYEEGWDAGELYDEVTMQLSKWSD